MVQKFSDFMAEGCGICVFGAYPLGVSGSCGVGCQRSHVFVVEAPSPPLPSVAQF